MYNSSTCGFAIFLSNFEVRQSCLMRFLNFPYFYFTGVVHNISLLRDILDRPAFIAGNLTTDFLKHEYGDGFKGK